MSTTTPPAAQPHVLREYALLADGQRGALIGPGGDIAWMCTPSWDSDAVFSSLIGGRGTYSVSPKGRFVWGGYYEQGSLIWRSRWITEDGIVECREALAFPGEGHRAVILRRVHAVKGSAKVDVVLCPASEFGKHRPTRLLRRERGWWQARVGGLRLRLSGSDAEQTFVPGDDGSLSATFRLAEGDCRDLVLELSDQDLDGPLPDPHRAWSATETAWHTALPALEGTLAQRDAQHSYAVLRGLTSVGGGMVAAATMGLPERAAQGRNYDYRYVWIRDQCFAGLAVAADGPHPLLDDAVRFVAERLLADGPNLRPAYTTSGAEVPGEDVLGLPGYPGGRDVLGNHANKQFQLDAFGEALLLFAAAGRYDRLGTDHHKAIATAVEAIEKRFQEPDTGIWELDRRRWTHSRLTCVAGLRAAAGAVATASDAADWSRLADAIVADAAADCLHPSGRWQRAPDDPRLDAALLLPPIRGGLAGDDPRTVATLRAIERELAEDTYMYRFRPDDRPLGEAEGAFLLCGFVMALAQHQQGDPVAAARWFERNRAACGPPGLYSEEYDVVQRQLRGNLPQAFVHALALESSIRLARPWDQRAGG